MNILPRIVTDDAQGELFYDICNDKGKEWLIAQRNWKTGLSIYQPTAFKGKMFKKCFALISASDFLCQKLNIEKRNIRICHEIDDLLKQKFGNDYQAAFFGGTPCIHQKTVMQIYSGNKIVAYCKVTVSDEIGQLFDRECENLSYLHDRQIAGIPEVLLRENVGELKLFCQSSVKNNAEKSPVRLTVAHYNFLENLYEKTRIHTKFEDTDYCKMLNRLEGNIVKLSPTQQIPVRSAMKLVRDRYVGKTVEFYFYHGDFTPWNMAVNNEELKLFDFEYAKKSYPKYLDLFHFFMQTEIFVKHHSADEICKAFEKFNIRRLSEDEKRYGMIMYLLEIIGLYLSRTETDVEEEKNMEIRIGVLEKQESRNDTNENRMD